MITVTRFFIGPRFTQEFFSAAAGGFEFGCVRARQQQRMRPPLLAIAMSSCVVAHSCCSYRSFVRDSQSSVPLPCGDAMIPACIGIARESCLLRTDLSPAWLHPSTCMHTKNVGSHPLFHKNLQLSVLGCDAKLHKVVFLSSCLQYSAHSSRISHVSLTKPLDFS